MCELNKEKENVMKLKVKLVTVNDAVLFVAKCNEYMEDIDYFYNRYIIDGKSLMGILGIGLNNECVVEIHTDDEECIRRFREDMALWIMEE